MGLGLAVYRPLQLPLWPIEVPRAKNWTIPPTALPQDPDAGTVRLCAEHRAECLEDPHHPTHDTWCPEGPHPVKVFLVKERRGQQRIIAKVNTAVTAVEVAPMRGRTHRRRVIRH